MGRFDHAQNMMNCIGVDYQPPTPAPVNHHIIGDDDEPHSSSSRSSSHASSGSHAINPATALYGGQHSAHHHMQHKRPYPHPVSSGSRHLPSAARSLPPPSMPPPSQHSRAARPTPPLMGPPTMSLNPVRSSESSTRMKEASRNLSKLNLEKVNSDQDIDKIFSEMINPSGAGGSAMPPPLSAIITPRVSKHEGNSRNAPPKYFSTVSPPSHKSPEVRDLIIIVITY